MSSDMQLKEQSAVDWTQHQRVSDRFKVGNVKTEFKTVASCNPELTTKHQEFYRKKKTSEEYICKHEEICVNRPVNMDMKTLFKMVHTSVTLPAQEVPLVLQDDEVNKD
jgi:hypothetical protein